MQERKDLYNYCKMFREKSVISKLGINPETTFHHRIDSLMFAVKSEADLSIINIINQQIHFLGKLKELIIPKI